MDESEDQSQTEDSSAGMCNGSLGREIMSAVQRNEAETQQQPGKKVSTGRKLTTQRAVSVNPILHLFRLCAMRTRTCTTMIAL